MYIGFVHRCNQICVAELRVSIDFKILQLKLSCPWENVSNCLVVLFRVNIFMWCIPECISVQRFETRSNLSLCKLFRGTNCCYSQVILFPEERAEAFLDYWIASGVKMLVGKDHYAHKDAQRPRQRKSEAPKYLFHWRMGDFCLFPFKSVTFSKSSQP